MFIKKYNDFIKEGMGGFGYSQYPSEYNILDNPSDKGKDGNIETHKTNNRFQSIQNELKNIISSKLKNGNSNTTNIDVENVLHKFFNLGNHKTTEIKNISDGCSDIKKCALEIYNKYIKYVKLNGNNDNVNDVEQDHIMESKLNGKYGFFMFLDIIDVVKNSFINEDYLNTSNYNIFFTTDNIKNKELLLDELEYKKSLDIAHITLKNIKNSRLSFYFGVKDFIFEYGYHDDIKRLVYKIGEFKITSSFLNNLKSYKSIILINNILKDVKLNNLKTLQTVKNDIIYLFDKKFKDINIESDNLLVKKISNDQLTDYYNGEQLTEYFDSWCFKHKWYYSIQNYTDVDEFYTYFYIKTSNTDMGFNQLKKGTDIKNISEDKETEPSEIYEPMNREPLNSNPKILNKKISKKNSTKIEKQKDLIKYYKDLIRVIKTIKKENDKLVSYSTKHLYKLVSTYDKSFDLIKTDIQWLNNKLIKNPDFIDTQTEKLDKMKKKFKK